MMLPHQSIPITPDSRANFASLVPFLVFPGRRRLREPVKERLLDGRGRRVRRPVVVVRHRRVRGEGRARRLAVALRVRGRRRGRRLVVIHDVL